MSAGKNHGTARTRDDVGGRRLRGALLIQPTLFQLDYRHTIFDGPRPFFDGPQEGEPGRTNRLSGQLKDIFELMRDGKRRTLDDISRATGHPPTSISAQLRHLRKKRFGAWAVSKEHLGNGLYHYWLDVSQ